MQCAHFARTINKHGRHRQFLFLIGRFLNIFYSETTDHWAKRFQRRRFLEIDQSETRFACGGHVYIWIGTKLALFIEDKNLLL
jgi:hypothetical protein